MELRCDSKKHGELHDGLIEVKCDSRFCGAGPGTVVLHQFDARTGDLVKTVQYKNPNRKEKGNGADDHSAAVRSA